MLNTRKVKIHQKLKEERNNFCESLQKRTCTKFPGDLGKVKKICTKIQDTIRPLPKTLCTILITFTQAENEGYQLICCVQTHGGIKI